ncbi:MAG: DUF3343 domain-containing protein [Firmicutes bacterium]|nr:DUF3343 domain-containing protein [Bacillota bacterium]
MRKASYYMLSFNSTHDAISAEKALAVHIPVQVMPTLRAVSESCGISLRVEEEEYPRLHALLQEQLLEKGHYMLYHIKKAEAGSELCIKQVEV